MGFKDVLRTAFPFIHAASSLGGPLGSMAAAAVGKALGIENVKADSIEDAITAAAAKDPEAMLKLKQAEEQFQLQMTQLGFDDAEKLAAIDAGDRASARAREVAVRDRLPAVLAISVTGGFFSLLWLFAFHEIPAASQSILTGLLGSLGTAWVGVINYYFGSSSGSAVKTEILAAQQSK